MATRKLTDPFFSALFVSTSALYRVFLRCGQRFAHHHWQGSFLYDQCAKTTASSVPLAPFDNFLWWAIYSWDNHSVKHCSNIEMGQTVADVYLDRIFACAQQPLSSGLWIMKLYTPWTHGVCTNRESLDRNRNNYFLVRQPFSTSSWDTTFTR